MRRPSSCCLEQIVHYVQAKSDAAQSLEPDSSSPFFLNTVNQVPWYHSSCQGQDAKINSKCIPVTEFKGGQS